MLKPPDEEVLLLNRSLKKVVLEVMFANCQPFYIHCVPHPNLRIGKRGLLQKEKHEGVVLVFGPHSIRNLDLDNNYIHCDLQFDRWETLQIPYECISRTFDKNSQVMMQWIVITSEHLFPKGRNANSSSKTRKLKSRKKPSISQHSSKKNKSRVIQVDFRKKS